eukprot:gene30139-35116_t
MRRNSVMDARRLRRSGRMRRIEEDEEDEEDCGGIDEGMRKDEEDER